MSASARSRELPPRWLHRWAALLACLVVGLIAAGALVTSKGAGLSVPDWPLSYGTLNPPNWWRISTVRAEHGHRLYAGAVALLAFGLAIAVQRFEPRRWVRRMAWLAVAAVLAQALLGGLTVLMLLPPAVSISHAALAELFLCLMVAIACVTGTAWAPPTLPPGDQGSGVRESLTPGRVGVRGLAAATTAAVFVQILLGAVMRHNGAGLAIPDFPLVFGGLLPPRWDFSVTIHFAHRAWGLAVALLVFWTAGRVLRRYRGDRSLTLPALLLDLLVVIQIGLGGLVVLTGRSVPVNTAHVATGATILALSLVLTLRLYRAEPGEARDARREARATRREAAVS
ncbi:MAG: COX15/CtaA family protein [Thermoanaerobaculia bacterium]